MTDLQQPLVWLDLEMTGLDPNVHTIIEIAVIITDGDLAEVIEGPDIVIAATDEELALMDGVVSKMHRKSGLTRAVRDSTVSLADAEETVLSFIREHIPEPKVGILAGNSIHADRSFLVRSMPAIADHLHYRLVDVSTVKELARRWYPDSLEGSPEKGGGHRALVDIRESIEELRYYRQQVFK